jgi:hypothetical protein
MAIKTMLPDKLKGSEAVKGARLAWLKLVVGVISEETHVASILLNTALALAAAGLGAWPKLDLLAGARSAGSSDMATLIYRALTVGRAGTRPPAHDPNSTASDIVIEATLAAYGQHCAIVGAPLPRRLPRHHGEGRILDFLSITLMAAFQRGCSAGKVHGVPARIMANLRASYTTICRAALASLEPSSLQAAIWRSRAHAIKRIVKAAQYAVMGLTAAPAEAGSGRALRVLRPTPFVATALSEPSTAALIKRHRDLLWSAEPALNARATRDEKARAAWRAAVDRQGGHETWKSFALHLNVAPRAVISYLAALIEERREWREEGAAAGFYVGASASAAAAASCSAAPGLVSAASLFQAEEEEEGGEEEEEGGQELDELDGSELLEEPEMAEGEEEEEGAELAALHLAEDGNLGMRRALAAALQPGQGCTKRYVSGCYPR